MVRGPQRSTTDSPTRVVLGTVIEVYPETRTIDVEVDLTGESDIFSSVPYGTLYTNVTTGTHVDFVPEVGSKCFVFTPSDGSDPIVMGWSAAPLQGAFAADDAAEPEDDFLGGRLGLAPGDIALYNRKGATVLLRKGGTLQIGSSPLAQTVYIPIDNFIRSFFQNYEAKSLLGTMYWKHGAIKTGEEKTTAQLYWGMKKDVEDTFVSVKIRAGRAGDSEYSPGQEELFGGTKEVPWKYDCATTYPTEDPQETTIVSICVDPENTGCTFVFQIDTKGNIFHKITGTMHFEANALNLKVAQGFTLTFGTAGTIEGTAAGALDIKVQQAVAKVLTSALISCGTSCTIAAPNIKLGSAAAAHPSVLGDILLGILTGHTHADPTGTVPLMTGPMSPVLIPGAAAILSGKTFIE